jgi:F0F1-type ATP synthase membrane subunit b/b'
MDLLTTLGLDGSVVWQFLIFTVVYLFLSQFLYKPYLKAFLKRQERTSGTEDQALKYKEETLKLEEEFEMRAKEINEKIKNIHQASKKEAVVKYEEVAKKGQLEAQNIIDNGFQKIGEIKNNLEKDLDTEVSNVSLGIVEKMLGKGI